LPHTTEEQTLASGEVLATSQWLFLEDDCDRSEDQKQQSLLQKQARTASQILCSIKKRRMFAADRMKGAELAELADQIIRQCKVAISNASFPMASSRAPDQQ